MITNIGVISTIRDDKDENGKMRKFLSISSEIGNRETFFKFMSNAKFFSEAESLFPHKFNKGIEFSDTFDKTKTDHPEYFYYDSKLNWEDYNDE
jgi:hypothetical protein